MDETTRSIIDRITVTYKEPRILPTGHNCKVFYDCADLSPNDLARLAAQATGHLDSDAFDVAVGIAYNGIIFAAAVAGGRRVAILQPDGKITGPDITNKKVVIVDDVVCTGKNFKAAEDLIKRQAGEVIGYVSIIDRSAGHFTPTMPLWSAYQTTME